MYIAFCWSSRYLKGRSLEPCEQLPKLCQTSGFYCLSKWSTHHTGLEKAEEQIDSPWVKLKEKGLPLKPRAEKYEFTHKSLFEYFVAKHLKELCNMETAHNTDINESVDRIRPWDIHVFAWRMARNEDKFNGGWRTKQKLQGESH